MSGRGGRGRGGGDRGGGGFSGFGGRGGRGGGGGDRGGGGGRGGGGFRGGGGGGFRGGRGGGGAGDTGIYRKGQPLNPNTTLAKAEDALVLRMSKLSTIVGETSMPRRPGYGTAGTPTWVRANYFPIELPKKTLYLYNVDITPEVKVKRKRRRLFDILEKHPGFDQYAKTAATDYSKLIVSLSMLNPKATPGQAGRKSDRIEIDVVYTDNDEIPPSEGRDRDKYKFVLNRVLEVSPQELQSYVDGDMPDLNSSAVIQALNIVIAKFPSKSSEMVRVGRDKFFVLSDERSLKFDLGGGLCALKGFYTSVRPSVGQMLCNLNVCTTAFYNDDNVATVILQHLRLRDQSEYNPNFHHAKLKSFLKRLRVETRHLKTQDGKTKVQERSIFDLERSPPRSSQFTVEDPVKGTREQMNVEQYFLKKHKIRLRYPSLPTLNIGSNERKVHVPPELATIVKGQPYMGKLPDEQTGMMITFACKPPKENAEAIEHVGLPKLGLSGRNNHIAPFDVKVSNEMMVVPARILQPPKIKYSSGTQQPRASWNLVRTRFDRGVQLANWSYMIINDNFQIQPQEVWEVLDAFANVCKASGMSVAPPIKTFQDGSQPLSVRLPSTGDPRRRDPDALMSLMKDAVVKLKNNGVKIVYVFLGTADKIVYSTVKYCGDVKAGLSTVCSQWSKVQKKQAPYLANVALKWNLKLGGINHTLLPQELGSLAKVKTMIVGCDVTHPSPGSLIGTPSIAGVVASVDSSYVHYPASLRLQTSRQEMIDDLRGMITERLKAFNAKSKSLPESIIVYRDGVSEGQFDKVNAEELPRIKQACRDMGPTYNPKISIIIVGKRHHTRFYPTDENGADKSGNPTPGTVVDRGVTAVYNFDFFLQAHAGLKGTVRPAHYYVIHDENKLGANQLQQLTHSLCYLFGRATKSVSICPPAYYADLACERGRCYIQGLFTGNDDRSTSSKSDPVQEMKNNVKRAQALWGGGVHPNLLHTMFYL